jgi:methionyl-tRNA formyltransferase
MYYRTVFMGSPEFSLPILQGLVNHYNVTGVVTQPDRPAGRGRNLTPPAVKILATKFGLPVIQPERLKEDWAIAQLHAWQPDFIVVAAFGQILRSQVLDLPPFGCINVHASLLPRWRGAAPIPAALLNDDRKTGITIMKMDPGVDTGPILNQRELDIQPVDTTGTLTQRLAEIGAALLLDTLPGYLNGEIQPVPQDDRLATLAPMLKKEDGRLDFNQSTKNLVLQVRAFTPWPGAFTTWNGQRLNIIRAHTLPIDPLENIQPGTAVIHKKYPGVITGDGILLLDEVQPAGKKQMNGQVFIQGARGWENGILTG